MNLERNEATGLLNVGVYCETLKRLHRAIQNKRRGMLISCVVLLEHCWSLSTGSCLTTLLTVLISLPIDYHMFTYLQNRLQSQRFYKNELMGDVKP
jgi:hypothetical protein